MKHREIGVAGCLGAIAGLAVAIVCEFGLLMLIPSALIGALTAFICYRPLEVASTTREFGRDAGGAMRRGMQSLRSIEKGRVWKITCTTAFVVACVVVGVGSAILLPALAFIGGILIRPTGGTGEMSVGLAVAMEAFFISAIGFVGLLFFSILGEIRARWPMPLTRRARSMIKRGSLYKWLDNREPTKGEIFLLCCLVGPAFCQVLGCLAMMALIVDAVLTIILACATSERVAAILGATLGFCTGTVLHFCGVPSSLAILVIGGTVGWFAGPLLYRLREYLSQVPAVETVQSS